MKLQNFSGEVLLKDVNYDLALEVQTQLVRLGYLSNNSQIDGIIGPMTIKAYEKFKKDNWLSHPQYLGETTAQLLLKNQPKIILNRFKFDLVFKDAMLDRKNQYFIPINAAMNEFNIVKFNRMAMFLAQVCHESGSLKWVEEIASGADYEGRADLGNTRRGDGRRYKGRGLIQLTGRANYRSVGKMLNLDLENNPTLALVPTNSARIAAFYWHSRGLNLLADKSDFYNITRKINGGTNGLSDRIAHLERIKNILELA